MYFRMLRLEVMINRKRLGLLILAGVGVALVMGVSFYVWHYIKAPFDNKIIPSFWDQLAYFYCGIPPFTPSRQESFEMPIAYLITNLVLLFALGNTTVSVFEPYGYGDAFSILQKYNGKISSMTIILYCDNSSIKLRITAKGRVTVYKSRSSMDDEEILFLHQILLNGGEH